MRVASIVIGVVGVAAIVFGSVWATTVFPSLKRIPSDYDQTVDFQGAYAVVANQEFLQELLSSPTVQQLFGSPQTLLLLARPEARQVLASDALRALLANPALLQQLLINPAAAAQIPDPAIRQALAGPTVQALLGDAVIRRLLADPTALRLMLDPRTLKLLADPLRPETLEIPVAFHRVRTAERTEGDVLFLKQDFVATVRGTGQALPQLSSKNTLAVHRKSRQYKPGGSEPRTGGFSFPFDVKKDREYSIWVTEVFQPLTARFEKEDEVDGLKVYNFRVKQQGLPLADQAKKDQGLPVTLDLTADVDLLFKTEPKTGIPVALESDIAYKLKAPALGNPTVFRGKIKDTDQSIADSVDDARDAKRLLWWLGRVLPWSMIGLGLVLALAGNILWSASPRKSPQGG